MASEVSNCSKNRKIRLTLSRFLCFFWEYYKQTKPQNEIKDSATVTVGCKEWWRHQMETFSALLALCAGNSPVTGEFPHKGQWRGALMFSLFYAWLDGWVNNRDAGLRRHRAHHDVTVMAWLLTTQIGKSLTLKQLGNFVQSIILFSNVVSRECNISVWSWSGLINI